MQAGSTYDLASTATKQLSASFPLTNTKHSHGDPNADFNVHIDIVGAVFSGAFIPEESPAALDHLTTTALPEPAVAILMSSALVCFAALRRTRRSDPAIEQKMRGRKI